MASAGTSQGSADSRILIRNNTCDNSYVGILVRGVSNDYDAGEVTLTNNIVSNSGLYGIALVNGYMYEYVANAGYYNNAADTLYVYTNYNPAYETADPYITGTGTMPDYYLRQNCNFINASDEYIEQTQLIGKTTAINGFPDSNLLDLGFHYPNWQFSNAGDVNALMMDLNGDLTTDFYDFAIMANSWRTTYNLNNMKTMADEWLKHSGPNIQIQISGDCNNGYVDIGVNGYSSDTQRIFLLANGKYAGEIFKFYNNDTLTFDISEFNNVNQRLKAVSAASNGHLTCSHISNVVFSRSLNYCVLPETYVKNQTLPFAAFNSGAGNITVKAYANGGSLVWSQTFSGNNIFGSIPASITNQYEFDYVSFDNSSGQSLVKKITDPVEPPHIENILALIVLPNWTFRFTDSSMISQIQKAFEARGIDYVKLSGRRATYNNVAWYAMNKPILYLYIDGDGDCRLGQNGPLRTYVALYDGPVISIKRTDYSNPNNAPPWCLSLGDYLETRLRSFATMGFTYLEFAQFDVCLSGHLKINNNQLIEGQPGQTGLVFDGPQSDMSFALGMGEPSKSRVFLGWNGDFVSYLPPFESGYQKWTRLEWQFLGEGEDLYWALYDTIWEQTDFGPDAPVNNYRLKGQGYLDDIYLRSW